jgi:hypothetical protein
MRNRVKSILLIVVISVLTFIIYNQRFDIEFKYHIYGFDKKLVDEDFLHPTFAYLKNEKLIGIKYVSNPECGQITKSYFLDENEILRKIIYETNFFTAHCDSSSLYIIKNSQNKIYVTKKNGTEINNEELTKMMSSFNIKELKKDIQKWKQ